MKNFLTNLLYENGAPSRTGIGGLFASLAPVIWLILSVHMYITSTDFRYYEAFTYGALGTGVAGCTTLGVNKYVNSTRNSCLGAPPTKGIPQDLPFGSLKGAGSSGVSNNG